MSKNPPKVQIEPDAATLLDRLRRAFNRHASDIEMVGALTGGNDRAIKIEVEEMEALMRLLRGELEGMREDIHALESLAGEGAL